MRMTRRSLKMSNVLHREQSETGKKIAVVAFIDHGIRAGAGYMIYFVLYSILS
jgi:hypothetical protein